MSDLSPEGLRDVAAMNAHVYAMSDADRAQWYADHPVSEYEDPEMLPPVEKIRYAERLIRREHRVVDDDYLFWGHVADHLNMAALIPEKIKPDWREFNDAQDMATGYIRMSMRKAQR